MTLTRNRATRIEARRKGALSRLQAGLNCGVRFSDHLGDCPHDSESRARANAEANTLALRIAKPAAIIFTRKSRTFAPWSAARAAHRAGKLA
jgi:hypothetical protein